MMVKPMGRPGKRSVDEASQLLKRLYFCERMVMRTLGGYLVNVSNWELKTTLPKHIWQDSLRADFLRTRVLELRYPRRDVDQGHDPLLVRYLESLIRCQSDAELVEGVYFVTKQALCCAYEQYLGEADPLDDAPTIPSLQKHIQEIQGQIHEMTTVYEQLPEVTAGELTTWQALLSSYLTGIGGVLGTESKAGAESVLSAAERAFNRPDYQPPVVPVRDPRFLPVTYHLPPTPKTFIEKQVWQAVNHINEMWAAEVPGVVMWAWDDMPWAFYLDCSRWAYDEGRHCLMGERRLREWGFEIGVDFAMASDHYVPAAQLGELHLLAMLHAMENGGPEWKSGLKEEFEANGDTASSQDFDYDWADEAIHLAYGRKWLLHRLDGDEEKLDELTEQCLNLWSDYYRAEQAKWDYEPFKSRIAKRIAEIEGAVG